MVIAALMILGPIIGNVFSKINSSMSGISGGGGAPAVACAAEWSRYNTAAAAQATNTNNQNQAIVDEYYASSAALHTCLNSQP